MNHKTIAIAVTLTAGIGLAVQDFGVPPGIPYEFVEGEVAVADEVNANFEWIEQQLDALDAADSSRSQSFLASGNVSYGDCFGGGGPWLGETMPSYSLSRYAIRIEFEITMLEDVMDSLVSNSVACSSLQWRCCG